MTCKVHLSPSNPEEHEPGHMALSWHDDADSTFRGFVFRVEDLPPEFQDPGKWRDYLFEHAVPGHVIEDISMRDKAERDAGQLLEQSWPANDSQVAVLQRICKEGPHGTYSFNPDDHPGAHNCVTWVTSRANEALGEVLPKVRQGRIKLMAEVLRSRQNKRITS
jgi:hypothetical protein